MASTQEATHKPHELELGWIHFPKFEELPPYGDAPLRGWTFVCEVIKDESFGGFGRPLARVKDLGGQSNVLVAFYLDSDQVSLAASRRIRS